MKKYLRGAITLIMKNFRRKNLRKMKGGYNCSLIPRKVIKMAALAMALSAGTPNANDGNVVYYESY